MIFTLITFLTAFAIEALGTLVSVIGLSTLFGANPIIIALAVALDAGKLVVVSLLYKHWDGLGRLMKTYAVMASIITMVITSAGAAAYLSGEFQKAIVGTQEGSLKVDVLKQQQAKYEERKKQIDAQIAALPEKTTVNQRLRLMNGFKAEQKDLQDKIAAIDKELPELQVKQIGVEAKAGPILYISKAFDIPVEAAVKWVILLIIFVFDPLAVFLIIAGNFLLERWRAEKKVKPDPLPPAPEPEAVKEPEEPEEAEVPYDPRAPLEVDVEAFMAATTPKEPQPPIIEELQPTAHPSQPLPNEQITLDQLKPLKSSFDGVREDHTVQISANPPASLAKDYYQR